jgi:hypothetical protein
MLGKLLHAFGAGLAHFLSAPIGSYCPVATASYDQLVSTLRPGDVLLVEGHSRMSLAIKYLTQSTWSHAALFLGNRIEHPSLTDTPVLIEADVRFGVRLVPLAEYANAHARICRPIGLAASDVDRLISDALRHVGDTYDLRNVLDLARYLFPRPPVPARSRRKLIALGSGEPTKAICSTLIAKLYQALPYPILPEIEHLPPDHPAHADHVDEILHIRHHSLYAPRDFDVSPYFEIVKPELPADFNYRRLPWAPMKTASATIFRAGADQRSC